MNTNQKAYIGCTKCRSRNQITTYSNGKPSGSIFFDFVVTMLEWTSAPAIKCPTCGTPRRNLNEKGEEVPGHHLRLVAVE